MRASRLLSKKFLTFLRNELCSNNLTDFGLRKGLDHLDEVRQTFQTITSRFAGYQAQWLNVHVDFPLLQRIALPITVGSVRYPGTKIHDVRVISQFSARRPSRRRLDRQANPSGRPHHLPSLRASLRPEPITTKCERCIGELIVIPADQPDQLIVCLHVVSRLYHSLITWLEYILELTSS